ncbi:MAG: hypothetical protein JWR08_2160 [Enterovirga sp.]|jgi:hypothetical protein|nr:hypothetical protein [Enterovirga sp.]
MTDSSLYDTDTVAWADRRVAELRRLDDGGISDPASWADLVADLELAARRDAVLDPALPYETDRSGL